MTGPGELVHGERVSFVGGYNRQRNGVWISGLGQRLGGGGR